MSYGVFVDLTSCAPKFRFKLNRDHPKRIKLKHDGASWGTMRGPFRRQPQNKHRHLMGKHAHARMFTRMHGYPRLCMQRTCTHKHVSVPFRRQPTNKHCHHHFNGETPSLRPCGNLPNRVFLLRSCSSFPTGRCRQGTPRKQHNATTTTTTRWRVSWVPCHPSRPGNFS